ncbi:MAG: polyprenyl diphosphate synthase, partial [Thermoplasmata archaeon]
LMKLFEASIDKELREGRIHKERVKVRVIGRRDILPEHLKKKIDEIENATKDYDRYILNLAIGYGGREEILKAIRDISREVLEGKISPEGIDEEVVKKHLYTKDLPDPDLILRTSGEERISNFLLWQMAYSELYFADVYWPSFSKIDFLRAILSYQKRERRFGK